MENSQVIIINSPGLYASLIRCGDEMRLKFRSDEDGSNSILMPNDKLESGLGIGLLCAADFVEMMLKSPGYSKNERRMMQEFVQC